MTPTKPTFRRAALLCTGLVLTLGFSSQAFAQNVLTNGDFETLPSAVNNGNNINAMPPGWTFGTGQRPNIVRVDGPGGYNYGTAGPESDASAPGAGKAQHYLDIANGSNSFYQKFTPVCPGVVKFGGAFSSRGNGAARGSITIRKGNGLTGNVVGQTNTTNIPRGDSQRMPWSKVDYTATLQPGQTYSFVVNMNNNANFDDGYVTYEKDCTSTGSGDEMGPLAETLRKKCIPCFGNKTNVYMGGLDDKYASGNPETTSPRAEFNTINSITGYNSGRPGISRDYDEPHHNEFFIETIKVPNADKIQKGWILFKTKDSGGLVSTDSISMGDIAGWYLEAQSPTGAGGQRNQMKARLFGKKYTDFRDLVSANGDPVFKKDAATGIVYANMADIQLNSRARGGTTSLLEQLKTDGLTDFFVQDDTMVDFVAIIACIPNEKGRTDITPEEFIRKYRQGQTIQHSLPPNKRPRLIPSDRFRTER